MTKIDMLITSENNPINNLFEIPVKERNKRFKKNLTSFLRLDLNYLFQYLRIFLIPCLQCWVIVNFNVGNFFDWEDLSTLRYTGYMDYRLSYVSISSQYVATK